MKTLVMIGCLLLTVPALAQTTTTLGTGAQGTGGTPYVGTLSAAFTTTYSVCGSGVPASDCWQAIPVQPPVTLTTVSASFDEELCGTTSAHAVYYLAVGATSWLHITAIPAVQCVAMGDGNLYAFQGSGQIQYSSDGGSSWTEMFTPYPVQFHGIAVSPSGDLIMALGEALGCGYRVYIRDQVNNTWTSTSQAMTSLSLINAHDGWGVCGDTGGNAYNFNGNTWTNDTGIGAAWIIATGNNRATTGGTLFAGTNDFWQRNETAVNGYMIHLTGAPSAVGGVSEDGIYGLFGATVEKFQSFTLQFTHNITGQYNCFVNCTSTYHTGPMTMQISGHGQQSNNFNMLMQAPVNNNLVDSLTPAEMFGCVIADPRCPSISVATEIKCLQIGVVLAYSIVQVIADQGAIKHLHKCYTREKLNLDSHGGKPFGCVEIINTPPLGPLYQCNVPVEAWCSNTHSPDLDPSIIHEDSRSSTGTDIYAPPGQTWENVAECFSFTGHAPWGWSELGGLAVSLGNSVGLGPAPDCTVTP